jgi:hypothetical protein
MSLAECQTRRPPRTIDHTSASTSVEPDRILERQARIALNLSDYTAVRQVCCAVNQGVVTLTGRVPSFHLKQITQTILLRLDADRLTIDNRLEVEWTQ